MLAKPAVDHLVVELDALLRNIAGHLRKRGRDILGNFEITNPQFDALLVLRENGELTMGELCAKMYLACSTATDLIDRMERNGLIERVRGSQDRRVIRLRVLEKGSNIIDEVLEARQTYLAAQFADLDEVDKKNLIQALEQLNHLMSRQV